MGRLLNVVAAGLVAGGTPTGAGAQEKNWEFTLLGDLGTAADPLRPGQATATVTLSARYSDGDAFAGAFFSVQASEPGWGAMELLPVQLPPTPVPGPYPDPLGRTPGVISGGDVLGAIVGQLHFPPQFIADPRNPIAVWQAEFTVTDFTPREISLSTVTERFAVYGFIHPRTPVEGSGVIHVIPAPAGLALLGLACLAAARRRS